MRPILLTAAASLSLTACGGPATSQENNSQANISSSSRPAATAASSKVQEVSMSPVSGDEAKAPVS